MVTSPLARLKMKSERFMVGVASEEEEVAEKNEAREKNKQRRMNRMSKKKNSGSNCTFSINYYATDW